MPGPHIASRDLRDNPLAPELEFRAKSGAGMRIGLVVYGSLDIVSGGYLYDRKLVEYLRSCGDQVEIISLRASSYPSHLLDNLSFRLPADLNILIEDELVHPSTLLANRRSLADSSRRAYPIISLVHNLHSSERRAAWLNAIYAKIEREHLKSAEGYIFNSDATRSSVMRLVPDQKPYVTASPGGDRLGTLGAEEVRRRVSVSGLGPLRLLFLANVTPLKGLHVVLDALSQLPRNSCTLEVAGSLNVDTAYARRMTAQAAAMTLQVHFHGVLGDRPLVDLLKRTDVHVLPSFHEGFGIAYLEGMAFGVPAIGTTAGAIPQLISHGVNGYMIAPGDATALADALRTLMIDRDLLLRMSLNALDSFRRHATWEQSAAKVREFLAQILAANAPGAVRSAVPG